MLFGWRDGWWGVGWIWIVRLLSFDQLMQLTFNCSPNFFWLRERFALARVEPLVMGLGGDGVVGSTIRAFAIGVVAMIQR